MEARNPPYQAAHPMYSPPRHPLDGKRHDIPPPAYQQARREVQGPPPPPPPPHQFAPGPPSTHPPGPGGGGGFYHQRRQTLESAPAPNPHPPRAEHRHTSSYPPPYIPPHDAYRQDGTGPGPPPGPPPGPAGPPMAPREAYHFGKPNGHMVNGEGQPGAHTRKDSRNLHDIQVAPAQYQQHPPHPGPPPPAYTRQPPGPVSHPPPPPVQHVSEHHKLGNGSMYHTPTSRSPPPPSPYSSRPMLPPGPGSPPYASPSYGPHGPPQQAPLPPPHYARDPPPSIHHRPGSGMSISAMLDNGPSRPPPDHRFPQPNGQPMNGHHHFPERDGPRGPIYAQPEHRSLTPDAYRSRHQDQTRPARAYSGGEAYGRPNLSPEKMTFGPLLPTHHEHPADVRPGIPPPHNSAPQSRRASITAGGPPFADRPSTGHLPGPYPPQGPPNVDHVGVPRPPPPPMPGHPEYDRGAPIYGPPDRRPWSEHEQRPMSHREEPPKSASYSFFAAQQQHQHQPPPLPPPHPGHAHDYAPVYGPVPRPEDPRDLYPPQTNGHHHPEGLPVYGPAPNPIAVSASAPPAPEQGPRLPTSFEGRKLSVDTLQQGRLESPLLRHRHLMDRANSTGSGRLSIGPDKRRAASPLPQAVQGAQAQPKGPTNEPNIKGEFGRMWYGLGSLTPTPTPVELVTKRYASPVAERDMDAERRASGTPNAGRFDLGDRSGRSASRTGKRSRKARDDDGMSSPTLELARSLSGRGGIKRSRNSYIGVDATSPVLGRNDSSVPWAAGTARQRSFTPTSYALLSASKRAAQNDRERERAERDRERDERKPKTIVTSKMVLDSVKNKPRKHLGSMLYDIKISPEKTKLGEEGSKYGYQSKPDLIPHFEDKDNCTFTVRISRRFLAARYREEVVERRNLWGSDVYTDDSDVLAAAIHSGWIRGEWGPDVDISMLSLNGRQHDNEYRPNGRSSLSVSVSPELSRKSLVNGKVSTNGTPSASPSKDHGRTPVDPDEVLTAPPKTGPVVPPRGRDAHVTILLLPRLQSYASTVNYGIKSRAWGRVARTSEHDGVSFMIHKIEWVDESPASRKEERGGAARHRRIAQDLKDRMGATAVTNFNLGGELAKETAKAMTPNGIVPAAKKIEKSQTVVVGA